jgi:PadR family transcriptional regulator
MDHGRPEILQGTLDLMILKALEALGPLHGFGIARRLEQVSDGILRLNEGTVYTALVRLGQRGWIRSSWGVSDSNRKARFYAITPAGRRRLSREEQGWKQIAGVVERVMKLAPGKE